MKTLKINKEQTVIDKNNVKWILEKGDKVEVLREGFDDFEPPDIFNRNEYEKKVSDNIVKIDIDIYKDIKELKSYIEDNFMWIDQYPDKIKRDLKKYFLQLSKEERTFSTRKFIIETILEMFMHY